MGIDNRAGCMFEPSPLCRWPWILGWSTHQIFLGELGAQTRLGSFSTQRWSFPQGGGPNSETNNSPIIRSLRIPDGPPTQTLALPKLQAHMLTGTVWRPCQGAILHRLGPSYGPGQLLPLTSPSWKFPTKASQGCVLAGTRGECAPEMTDSFNIFWNSPSAGSRVSGMNSQRGR